MRIHCPSCGVVYEIPDILAVRPQSLKCACCDAVWRHEGVPEGELAARDGAVAEPVVWPEPPEPAWNDPPPEEDGLFSVMLEHERDREVTARAVALVNRPSPESHATLGGAANWTVAWMVTGALVLGATVAIWHSHATLVQIWPPLGRLFG